MLNNQKKTKMNYEQYTLSVIYHASMKGVPLNCNKSGLTLFQEARQALIDVYISRKSDISNKVMLELYTNELHSPCWCIKERNGYEHFIYANELCALTSDMLIGEEKTVAHLVLSDGEVIEAVYKYESFKS